MVSFFNAVIGKFCRKDVREEILNRLLCQVKDLIVAYVKNLLYKNYFIRI